MITEKELFDNLNTLSMCAHSIAGADSYKHTIKERLGDNLQDIFTSPPKTKIFLDILKGDIPIVDDTMKGGLAAYLREGIKTKEDFCGYTDEITQGATLGRHGLGDLQALTLMIDTTNSALYEIKDALGNNYATAVTRYTETTSSFPAITRTGYKILGCNDAGDERFVIVFDQGKPQGYGGEKLGVVENQLYEHREEILSFFKFEAGEHTPSHGGGAAKP